MAATLAEAEELAAEAKARGRVLQVGHIERYSAALRAVKAAAAGRQPRALEATRVAPFRPRSLDVSVVMDLMVHDLDLVLDLAGAPLVEVKAAGSRVVTDKLDFAQAQLSFANGARATVTASRVSVALERRLRLLGPEGEMRVDFLSRSLEMLGRDGGEPLEQMPGWGVRRASWTEHDSLEAEHAAFLASITDGAPVEADAAVGLRALDAALRVEQAAG
jgi:predicted dehydrogenase